MKNCSSPRRWAHSKVVWCYASLHLCSLMGYFFTLIACWFFILQASQRTHVSRFAFMSWCQPPRFQVLRKLFNIENRFFGAGLHVNTNDLFSSVDSAAKIPIWSMRSVFGLRVSKRGWCKLQVPFDFTSAFFLLFVTRKVQRRKGEERWCKWNLFLLSLSGDVANARVV